LSRKPYNEMHLSDGAARTHYFRYAQWLNLQAEDRLTQKRAEADALFHRVGITFAVYGQEEGAERLIPFDIVPRVLPREEWMRLESGLKQRVRALNAFIHDIYHDQQILKAGVIPAEQVLCNSQYRPEMQGIDVPGGIYAHIAGIDIVRDDAGEFCVLEDNLRVPSGVSYMLENRKMMMRLFPELFSGHRVAPVDHYPEVLLDNLRSVAPIGVADPTVVLLTAGAHNSAYFEHAFLAQQMGIELVEGQDLFVRDEAVFTRTTQGPQRVDVIYRRIDDDFLDPLVFRPDSMLGVPGLLTAYRPATSTSAPSYCPAATSPSSPADSPASRCAKDHSWSIPRRAAAPKTPGCWRLRCSATPAITCSTVPAITCSTAPPVTSKCSAVPPTTSTGCRATSNAPKASPAWSTPTTACPYCPTPPRPWRNP
jgi:uncharacterized circularly permuted ATP-grasp superfamily protein